MNTPRPRPLRRGTKKDGQDFTVTTLEDYREEVRADFETIPVDDTLAKFDKSIEVSNLDRLLQEIDSYFDVSLPRSPETRHRVKVSNSKVRQGLISRQIRDNDFGD